MKRNAVLAILMAGLILSNTQVKGEDAVIEKGKKVAFDYTLTVEEEVVDTSEGKEPLNYIHGEGTIIKGLSAKLEGMKVGDKQTIAVAAADAYGEIDPKAFIEVPKKQFPEGETPEVGMMLNLNHPNGGSLPALITEIKDDVIVLNVNHPLAGKDLLFDVKIVSVE